MFILTQDGSSASSASSIFGRLVTFTTKWPRSCSWCLSRGTNSLVRLQLVLVDTTSFGREQRRREVHSDNSRNNLLFLRLSFIITYNLHVHKTRRAERTESIKCAATIFDVSANISSVLLTIRRNQTIYRFALYNSPIIIFAEILKEEFSSIIENELNVEMQHQHVNWALI